MQYSDNSYDSGQDYVYDYDQQSGIYGIGSYDGNGYDSGIYHDSYYEGHHLDDDD